MAAPLVDRLRSVKRAITKTLATGDRVACPCCGGGYRLFLQANGRKGVLCPSCGSKERHRLLWLYLTREAIPLDEGRAVLHFAPEFAIERRLRELTSIKYLPADLHPGPGHILADLTSLPFSDRTIDLIICVHVLEHVPDDRTAMAEMHRVLKPDGVALLMHPIDFTRSDTAEELGPLAPSERRRRFGQEDHVRLYGRDFRERLLESGFAVEHVNYVRELPPEAVARFGLSGSGTCVRGDDIFVCRPEAST